MADYIPVVEDFYYVFTHSTSDGQIFHVEVGINLFCTPVSEIPKSAANRFDLKYKHYKEMIKLYGTPIVNIIAEGLEYTPAIEIRNKLREENSLWEHYNNSIKPKRLKKKPISRYSIDGIWEQDYPSCESTKHDGYIPASVIMSCNPERYPNNKNHRNKIWKYKT